DVAMLAAIGLADLRGLAAEVEARLLRIAHRPGAGLAADMGGGARCRFRRGRRHRRFPRGRWGRTLGPSLLLRNRRGAMGKTVRMRQRLAMGTAGLARARHPTRRRRIGRGPAARLRRGAGLALDRGWTAGQAQAVGFADHRITRDAAEDRRNLAGSLALAPELAENFDPLFRPLHRFSLSVGYPQDVVSV